MTTLSEVFYVCLLTTISGMILKLASMAYKSKCKEASFCCFKVIRDTEAEEKEEEFRISHPPRLNEMEGVREEEEQKNN